MAQAGVVTAPQQVVITDSAAARIAKLAAAEAAPGTKLRITISGGGCSGFRYDFGLDSAVNDDDRVFSHEGAAVVVDEVSLDLLGGAVIDFVEDLSGAAFQIRNPNAASSCGCGTSFAI
ncbi:MAG: iron-sulfur cluster insertion protein ErpA [Alphaproteobacteria bacterium]